MTKRRLDDQFANNSAASPIFHALGGVNGFGTCFVIDGRQFVAVPQLSWAALQRDDKGKSREVGIVRLDGVLHVLVERDEFAAPLRPPSPVSSLLTGRELQIAYSVADGKGDKMIAYELGISEYTVREHMRRIFHKLKVSKRAALVAQLISTRVNGALPRRRARHGAPTDHD